MDLLLEVGCEELPAAAVKRAAAELGERVRTALTEANLIGPDAAATTYATPRRLIVALPGVLDRQPDAEKEQRGPGVKAAYDADGNPTPALQGFCRSQGIEVADLRNDGQYVWVTKRIPGRPATEVLADALPAAIKGLTFDKTMRWGHGRTRFARPIRWLLATLDGAAVPFEIEGVPTGTQSQGHRSLAPGAFEATTLSTLLAGLRERFVEPDPTVREATIRAQAAEVADGTPVMTDALVEENVYLTEWPTAIAGHYREEFRELPEPVLVTAMAKHEKMFPVRDAEGRLTDQFVFIRNSGEDATVRKGAEWVLNARFNDAKFFFDLDRHLTMEDLLEKTATIVFQEKLGTVRQRAERLESLCEEIARATGASDEELTNARRAGRYAKADLASGLVSELASLQGIVGGQYARREGMPGAVAWALETQYDLGKNLTPRTCDGERTSLRLGMADNLDKLAGYLGLGLEPTGSSDPYGLRRAVTQLIEAAWAWPGAMPPYDQLMELAFAEYRRQGIELNETGAYAALCDLFAARYPALMTHARYDILDAALLMEMRWEVTMPQGVRLRVAVLTELAQDHAFVFAATRPLNIVAAARKKGVAYAWEDPLRHVNPQALDSADGEALLTVLRETEEDLFLCARESEADGVVENLRQLQKPIDRFFESTMVMVDDEATRTARLTLLHATCLHLLRAGDFTKLVVE